MCGIFGAVGENNLTNVTLNGLKTLEYRGYDSAGIVGKLANGEFKRYRVQGEVNDLITKFQSHPFVSDTCISHTRWATHGAVSVCNAHPLQLGDVTVVCNGIIENYREILKKYQKHSLTSDTDVESLLHFILHYYKEGLSLFKIVQKIRKEFVGNFTFLAMTKKHQGIWGFRKTNPLIIGKDPKKHVYYLSSDVLSILPLTQQVIFLNDNMFFHATYNQLDLWDDSGLSYPLEWQNMSVVYTPQTEHPFSHQTLKEIYDQPMSLSETYENYVNTVDGSINFPENVTSIFEEAKQFTIMGCGAAYFAGEMGKFWFEDLSHVPTESVLSSEFRTRSFLMNAVNPVIAISQSGETKDTIDSVLEVQKRNHTVVPIINVPYSLLSRMATPLYTTAFPEIGVSTTKAFSSQLLVLLLIALYMGKFRNTLSPTMFTEILRDLKKLPNIYKSLLQNLPPVIEKIGRKNSHYNRYFFLARGSLMAVANEGALKLKEIAYKDAISYVSTELKHGPIALVDELSVGIFFMSEGTRYKKIFGNMQEFITRKGKAIVICTKTVSEWIIQNAPQGEAQIEYIILPDNSETMAPFTFLLASQLLCYYIAVALGRSIDKPKNLAKSVTVE